MATKRTDLCLEYNQISHNGVTKHSELTSTFHVVCYYTTLSVGLTHIIAEREALNEGSILIMYVHVRMYVPIMIRNVIN